MLVALSGQINIIADPGVSGFEGLIQRFEVTPIGMNVCGTWDINRENCSPIAQLFLAKGPLYMLVGLCGVGMVYVFCRTIHLHVDRPCVVDL